jgi:MFS family permease
MAPGSTLSPLGYPLFAVVWLSVMASHMANSIQGVAAQWLMTSMGGGADMVGLIHTATSLPVMLLALIGGAIADMYDRRTVMLAAQLCVAASSVLLASLAYGGLATPWLLIGLTLVVGTGMAFFQPAVNASIQNLVPRGEISGAIGLNVTGFNVARTVGPAIGGAIVAAGGTFVAFIVSATFSIVSASIVARWRPPANARTAGGIRAMLPAIAEGLRTVRDKPQLRAIAVRSICFTFAGSALWALMPLVARDVVGGGAESFGMLLGSLGLGALVGSIFSHEFRRRFTPEWLARTAGTVFGVAAIIVAIQPGIVATMAVLVVGGAFWVQALSGFTVSGQMWAPRHIIGRVTSTISVTVWGGLALGGWFWGTFAEIYGIVACIAGSGTALLAVVLMGLVMPLPRNDMAPDQAAPSGAK